MDFIKKELFDYQSKFWCHFLVNMDNRILISSQNSGLQFSTFKGQPDKVQFSFCQPLRGYNFISMLGYHIISNFWQVAARILNILGNSRKDTINEGCCVQKKAGIFSHSTPRLEISWGSSEDPYD